jgi:hypothetical protein
MAHGTAQTAYNAFLEIYDHVRGVTGAAPLAFTTLFWTARYFPFDILATNSRRHWADYVKRVADGDAMAAYIPIPPCEEAAPQTEKQYAHTFKSNLAKAVKFVPVDDALSSKRAPPRSNPSAAKKVKPAAIATASSARATANSSEDVFDNESD